MFTGDLADRGEPEAYRQLREMVEPFAERLGAQVVWCMGNHDNRAAYARGLFDAEASPEVLDRVYDVDGLRIVSLDTSVPGYHHGEITDAQYDWLADVLAEPAPHGTFLAMHHPPIPIPMLPAAAIIELDDQQRLADALARHRRPDDPGRPLPLLVVQHLRRHPGLGRVGDLLHQRHRARRSASSPPSTPSSR